MSKVIYKLEDDIYTDIIYPGSYMATVLPVVTPQFAFDDIRDLNEMLNNDKSGEVKYLVAGKNFGCGSSREHAPWALLDFGIRCVISTSFADIFYNNCFKNGLLPIALTEMEVDHLFNIVAATPGLKINIDLERQVVEVPGAETYRFEVEDFRKQSLLNGWDDIGLTLRHAAKIREFEEKRRIDQPWLFA